ncbi:Na+/H+ antiporter subunit E [Desulfohalobium retbaense]|uniref:Cation antiporter n=1 Tax=Desulfohalobium retbaense (strain ATCC 49708 / DSM 5692 / JCM 16813 / HR100) TaxID=485915 RepID=C8X0Z0_DESRD|nr:Na+/H+ antiporter subunit E [Desulfohalobium retbaense]ACV68087.1 cation antiporter [Desulfohalobium retbaense DSM 5692]
MAIVPEQRKPGVVPVADRTKGTFTGRPRGRAPFLFTSAILFVIWIILSGRFDWLHLTYGLLSSLLVAYFSSDLLFISADLSRIPGQWLRFVLYLPYLFKEIFMANLHMLYLVFHPRMMDLIDPQIIKFQGNLQSDMSVVTLANSITLTPGTITMNVSPVGVFTVHGIDRKSASALPGDMRDKVAQTFGESEPLEE